MQAPYLIFFKIGMCNSNPRSFPLMLRIKLMLCVRKTQLASLFHLWQSDFTQSYMVVPVGTILCQQFGGYFYFQSVLPLWGGGGGVGNECHTFSNHFFTCLKSWDCLRTIPSSNKCILVCVPITWTFSNFLDCSTSPVPSTLSWNRSLSSLWATWNASSPFSKLHQPELHISYKGNILCFCSLFFLIISQNT